MEKVDPRLFPRTNRTIEMACGMEERQGRGRATLFEVIGGSAWLLKPIPATTGHCIVQEPL